MTDEMNDGALLHPDWLQVESLDLEAQGVAHRADGKVVFIEGALPFEQVSANVHRSKNNWEQGTVTAIHRESSQRVTPGCPHFGLHTGACGGCKMQHLHVAAQVAVKQRVLEDNLWHLGKVRADTILRPIEGPAWGYRYRARRAQPCGPEPSCCRTGTPPTASPGGSSASCARPCSRICPGGISR